ncbi:MAG: PEGA domain-containing protein [Ignavibacteriaceae bacterium]|nr:PEGA domain-containing protein [Ignavibacteriaceae bacterium]
MKKIFYLLLIPFAVLIVNSCSEDPVSPVLPEGNLYISSIPSGAQIWIDGVNTTETTNDTVFDIDEGIHNITLKRNEYKDTSFSVSIIEDETSTIGPIVLVSDIQTTLYGPFRIWESYGTPASLPSGIDLSSGNVWGVSSDSSGVVDIYYYSDGTSSYLIQSADLAGLTRETDFLVGTGTNLLDGNDSPLRNAGGAWTNNIDESENNYVFLYDHDAHYSKFLIVNRGGGGGPGDPAYVDVQWFYNKVVQDNRFK